MTIKKNDDFKKKIIIFFKNDHFCVTSDSFSFKHGFYFLKSMQKNFLRGHSKITSHKMI